MRQNLKKGRRPAFKFFAAALLLALSAAVRAADLRSAPSVTLPPLLVGPVSEAASPLWRALDARAGAPVGQTLALDAAPAPIDVLSARVLARAAAEPQAAAALLAAHPDPAAAARLSAAVETVRRQESGTDRLASLAAAAKADPAAASFFDGSAARPSLGLEGVASKGTKLHMDGRKLEVLGQGEFGVVHPHPKIDGAVIKAVEHGFGAVFFSNKTVTETALQEEGMSRALAAADAGPRYFGREVVARREVSVRERVYGETLENMIHDRRFTQDDYDLVLDLLRRMAKGRLLTDDKHPRNIMIGRTLLDPRRRAYLVDGGNRLEVPADINDEAMYEKLLRQDTILMVKMDPYVGEIVRMKPFKQLLDEGLKRAQTTSTWNRFLAGLKEAFSSIHTPMR